MKTPLKLIIACLITMLCRELVAKQFVPGFVPDWNQPYAYPGAPAPGGPGADPNPGNPPNPAVPDPWDAWCAPTSAANLAGHFQDQYGKPVADGQAFANSPNWPNAAWHDYEADAAGRPAPGAANPALTTDQGWYMDTNNRGANLGNGAHTGTYIKDIHVGLNNFLNQIDPQGGWMTRTQGAAFAASSNGGLYPAVQLLNAAVAFNDIKLEINAGRTLIVSWTNWNLQATGLGPLAGSGTGESSLGGTYYNWATTTLPTNDPAHGEEWNGGTSGDGLGHAVTAVGYIDRNTAGDPIGNTDWVIVHDNWQTTPQNVIVPFVYNNWAANTEVIPEPPTFALMALGLGALLVWRRKRIFAR